MKKHNKCKIRCITLVVEWDNTGAVPAINNRVSIFKHVHDRQVAFRSPNKEPFMYTFNARRIYEKLKKGDSITRNSITIH